jgi:hypothetical protein
VENELPWAGWGSETTEQYALAIGVLAFTNALLAKAEFARLLQSRYSSVSGLNAAWNTSIASWNDISNYAVALSSPLTAACAADRGRAYQEYLRSVLSLPAFVGCHWFQYCDEPLTGRFDGENYNIGLVSGTDTPYGELVAAAQQIQSEVYARKH